MLFQQNLKFHWQLRQLIFHNFFDLFQFHFLIYEYKDRKELEINKLNENHLKLKNEIDINQKNYEKLIDEAADEISSFVEKANLENLS